MFPLKKRLIGGYQFGQKTYYSNFHLGTDYYAKYVPLYAPFNGSIVHTKGKEGGEMIYFKPDGQDVIIRFLHLDKVYKTGKVKEGEEIAKTGNSGESSTPHLHLDISKHVININDPRNFINPERFDWSSKKEQSMFTPVIKKVKINGAGGVLIDTPLSTMIIKVPTEEMWRSLKDSYGVHTVNDDGTTDWSNDVEIKF
jgi:hypothetical protein